MRLLQIKCRVINLVILDRGDLFSFVDRAPGRIGGFDRSEFNGSSVFTVGVYDVKLLFSGQGGVEDEIATIRAPGRILTIGYTFG